MKKLLAILCVGIFLSIAPAQAQQPQCNDRDVVLKLLDKKYKEKPAFFGVTSTGGLLEVLTAEDGSTWTIIITSPKGVSCLVAAGEGWRGEKLKPSGPEI